MRNNQVIEAFLSHNEEMSDNKNLRSTGTKLFLYSTCIAEWVEDTLIVNLTKYSRTTSKIQNRLVKRVLNHKTNTMIVEVDGINYDADNLKGCLENVNTKVLQ